jgi:hypothetical protein
MVEKLFLLLKNSIREKSPPEGVERRTYSIGFWLPYLYTTVSHVNTPIV